MADTKNWKLWEVSPVVYTLEDANRNIDHTNNLIARCVPRKKREERKLARKALERLSSQGVECWLRNGRIELYRSALHPLYELKIGTSTVWRMFLVKHEGNVYVVIIDVFESHKGDDRLVKDRARRCKEKYEIAFQLAVEKFGGA